MDGYVIANSFANLCGREGLQGTDGAQPEVWYSKAKGGAMSMSLMAGEVTSGI